MLTNKRMLACAMLGIILVAALAVASPKGSSPFNVPETMLIAGKEIKAGQYDVKWESNSSEATVTFSVLGKPILEVKGKVVEGDKKFEANSFLIGKDASGRKVIKEIQYSGKKTSIVLE